MDPECPIDFYYRYGHASVVHEERMWLIGGVGRRGELQNDVWYSTDGSNWTSATLNAKWPPRQNHSAVVHDGKMWVLGGGGYQDVWYSSDGVNWTSATLSAPWPSEHTSVSFDGKIWVMEVGGVWSSPDGTSWTLESVPPWTCSGMKAVVCDRKIWVLGGPNRPVGPGQVWYSSDGRTWLLATSNAGWLGRQGHTAVVHDRKIWIMGGWYSTLEPVPATEALPPTWYNHYLNDVWYSAMPTAVPASWQLYP